MKKRTKKRWIVISVIIVFHVLGFISSIFAVMETRTAQGAVAWAVTLNAFPYVAVPAYWVLGRSKFEGYVTSRQEGDHEIRHIAKLASQNTLDLRSTRAEEVASVRQDRGEPGEDPISARQRGRAPGGRRCDVRQHFRRNRQGGEIHPGPVLHRP